MTIGYVDKQFNKIHWDFLKATPRKGIEMNIYAKGDSYKIAKGLTTKEFECKCKNKFCTATIVSEELAEAYANFRLLVNVKLKINSGFRCGAHNFKVGGKSLSRHQTGQAIDISLETLQHLDREELEFALKQSGFTFTIIYDNFIHADVR